MITRRLILAVALVALAPALARAAGTAEPHGWTVEAGVSCTSCHTLHNAPGVNYTTYDGNFNLCASCHNFGGVGLAFGFPWYTEYQASPLLAQPVGRSHRWDAPATNVTLGAQPPVNAELLAKLDTTTTPGTNRLQCSTCHDEHNANPAFGGAQHVSVTLNQALPRHQGTGSGTLTVLTPAAAAAAKAYVIEIVGAGNVGVATYRISNDGARTWLGWQTTPSPGWVAWNTTTPNPRVTGPTQALNDASNVQVTFGGTGFAQGDRWEFYVAYPMLRASIIASAMCEDCHRSMVHSSARVRGEDPTYLPDGVRLFSHPVGLALNSNGFGYDRPVPLRVTGAPQTATVTFGDLAMSSESGTDKVRCLTCHKVHESHSNSILQ